MANNMKSFYSTLLVLILVVCCCGAGPCWIKHQQQHLIPIVVAPPVYGIYGYQYQYVPVVVQERRLVPVVENRVEYRPVVGQFFMNYSHYYSVPNYGGNYQYYPWAGYGY